MITIINYGLGNIMAFVNIYKRLNTPLRVAKSADEVVGATKLILPGVGAFDYAMTLLEASGMRPVLNDMVLGKKVPVLGICVGMQIMAASSDEGTLSGLGWIRGKVRAFKSVASFDGLPLPHMGWNDITHTGSSELFKDLGRGARFYFLHSFFFDCDQENYAIAYSYYGMDFCCAVHSENVFGVQFHPEKSHMWGIQLLKNFAEL